jgi:hypothetical protein
MNRIAASPGARPRPGVAAVQPDGGTMNRSTHLARRPRRTPRGAARTVAAIIATAFLALVATACSDSPSSAHSGGSPGTGGAANAPSAIAYSACMRSHGVPNYPDPGSGGQLPKTDAQRLGVSNSEYQAAQQACGQLLPTGGSLQQQASECGQNHDCSPALVQQMLTDDLKLARCMRSHGVPNFPDPASNGSGAPYFPISSVGISEAASRTPQFVADLNQCGRLTGDNAPESFG